MKIENYKCDICGKWCNPQHDYMLGDNTSQFVTIRVWKNIDEWQSDICASCLLEILNKVEMQIRKNLVIRNYGE